MVQQQHQFLKLYHQNHSSHHYKIVQDNFHKAFAIKKINLISSHDQDDKEGWFLHRRIAVSETGWSEQLDERYGQSLVKGLALENGKKGRVPGPKPVKGCPTKSINDAAGGNLGNILNPPEHRNFREREWHSTCATAKET